VIPNTLLGLLLLLLAGLGPGYVYVLVAERREPRIERSPLLEVAGLLTVGALTTGTAALTVLIFTQATGLLDVRALVENGSKYVAMELVPSLVALVVILGLSYGGAITLALAVHRGKEATLYPNRSVWWQTIGQAKTSGPVFATVELKDGRIVDGYVSAYTIDSDAGRRDLALQRPLFVRQSGRSDRAPLDVDYIILPDSQIVYLSLQRHRNSAPDRE